MDYKAISLADDYVIEEHHLADLINLAEWQSLKVDMTRSTTKLSAKLIGALMKDLREDRFVGATHSNQAPPIGSSRIGVLRPDQLFALVNLGLADEVANSESLLALADDWDGEGSPGYTQETWRRAVMVLLAIASHLRDDFRRRPGSVEILPGSYGNIDVEMNTEERMLFLSIPADQGSPARYYGHDSTRRNVTKGTLDLRTGCHWLAEWLAGE